MSKELTEQWRNGTLKAGTYYVKFADGFIDNRVLLSIKSLYEREQLKEVLAPVPTYDEWEELQEANDGLSKIMFKSLMNRFVKADEERERLEQQLESETLAKQEGVEIIAELEQKMHTLRELIIEGRFVEALKVLGDK